MHTYIHTKFEFEEGAGDGPLREFLNIASDLFSTGRLLDDGGGDTAAKAIPTGRSSDNRKRRPHHLPIHVSVDSGGRCQQ